MLQHYVWFREPAHQRVIVQGDKTSELSSPIPADQVGSSQFKIEIGPNELEAQNNAVESISKPEAKNYI